MTDQVDVPVNGTRAGPAHPEGLRVRPGGPLVPGLRRLLDPRPDPEGDAGLRRAEGEHRVHLRHRLLQPVPVLHEHLRVPHDPRPGADDRDGPQGRAPGPHGLGGHRRRRRAVDRRQPPPALDAPQRRPDDPPVQQPDLRPDQGPDSPTSELGQADEVDADGLDRPADQAAARSRSPPRRRSSPARSTRTPSTCRTRSRRPAATAAASFVEILQNCNIFNDGAWRDFTERDVRDDRMLVLEHGKPMIFGKDRDKGIRLNGLHPEVVTIGEDGVTEDDLLVHDAHAEDPYLALILSRMFWPEFPVPGGRPARRDPADPLGPDRRPDPAGDREVRRGRHRQGARVRRDLDGRVGRGADALPRLPPRQLRGRGHLHQLRRRPPGRRPPAARASSSTTRSWAATSTRCGVGEPSIVEAGMHGRGGAPPDARGRDRLPARARRRPAGRDLHRPRRRGEGRRQGRRPRERPRAS